MRQRYALRIDSSAPAGVPNFGHLTSSRARHRRPPRRLGQPCALLEPRSHAPYPPSVIARSPEPNTLAAQISSLACLTARATPRRRYSQLAVFCSSSAAPNKVAPS
ncbi:hypothetical protein OBBRIDRAFT_340823 [Obba rivulosa]|uniref:Uncharacterized protein n=1 Tax=Obba rivulosa TaxID=1052685 RepID=A0A8E2DPD6_9APHY|nr:hypothetical protein OBBRIDRAFT_340823 [Obba rivulosa]